MATGGRMNTDILSDDSFDILCRVCKLESKNAEAEKYCVECQDYYCLTCVNIHEDIPSLTGHKILDKDKFPSRSVKMLGSGKTSAPIERCDRHAHHYIDMYCQNHGVVGCGTCMAVDHRLCKDTFYIPEFLQVTKQYRKEISKRLDELEKNTTTDIEDRYKAIVYEIEKAMEVFQTNKANETAAQDKVASTGFNPSHIFVNVKKGQQIADKAAINTEENQPQVTEDVNFQADQRISTLLREINASGQITQMTRNADHMGSGDVLNKEALLQVHGSKKYSVRVKSDKKLCDIVSACTLEDGQILLSDYYNSKLKRLDTSTYTVTDYCDLPGTPCEVCSINKQQAAVCLTHKREVRFISLSNRMTLKNKIKTDFDCYGLAYAYGNLYISDVDASVYIYSVSGRRLKQLKPRRARKKKLFSDIRSLAVSEDGSRIYVADYDKGFIILDNNGKAVGRYSGHKLEGANGSYLTERGRLLVCGHSSNNVLQLGLDGELIGQVVKFDKYTYPTAICCNQQMSKMIIGRWEDDQIEVCDLK